MWVAHGHPPSYFRSLSQGEQAFLFAAALWDAERQSKKHTTSQSGLSVVRGAPEPPSPMRRQNLSLSEIAALTKE